MLTRRHMLAALAALLLLALTAGAAKAAPPAYDIRGTWDGVAGGAAGTVTWVTENCVTGAISGSGSSPSDSWPASGTIDGATVQISFGPYKSDPAYSSSGVGTFSDQDHISGTFHDTETYKDTAGTFQLTRASGPPQDGQGCGVTKRSTATAVSCNLEVATGIDTCTATVGDAGAPPRVTPAGSVAFTSSSGGVFLAGDSCPLTPTPLSPGVAGCSVRYRPSSTAFPDITAAYGGDDRHASSSGKTALVAAAITEQDEGPLDPTSAACAEEMAAATRLLPATVAATPGCDWKESARKKRDFYCISVWLLVPATVYAATKHWVAGVIGALVTLGAWEACEKWTKNAKDPPDPAYTAIALPRAARLGAADVPRTCGSLSRATCRQLLPAARRWAAAEGRVTSLVEALGTTQDRLLSAVRARDFRATALQVAARKTLAGELAAAELTARRAGTTQSGILARLIGSSATVHLTGAISAEQLQRVRSLLPRAVRSAIPIPLPAWLTDLVAADAPRTTANVAATLRRASPSVTAFRRDHRSMKLENLRALVRGLARRKVVTSAKAGRLLAELTCSRTRRRPDVPGFRVRARTSLPRAYADFVRFAAEPLAGRRLTCTG